jgi:hypothetical protein
MRVLLVLALLQQHVAVSTNGDWIGTLNFFDSRGEIISPVTAHVTIRDTGAVSGDWVGSSHKTSGQITGTFMGGRFKLDITFYGGAVLENAETGKMETIATERCQGTATFTGDLFPSGVIRLTARKVSFDDPIKQAKHMDCEDIAKVTWLLQPHRP